MDSKIREAQNQILKVFSKEAKDFALAGGTALELYYLHHRFSADLDFFSRKFASSEINNLVSALRKNVNKRIHLESELITGGKAKVQFYSMPVKGSNRLLKIDFVEDVFFKNPTIRDMEGIRVYSVENIYLQKIVAASGTRSGIDNVGRPIMEGRKEARDVFDIYVLSKKVQPLHIFLQNISSQLQRGMIHWYRTFSRQELQLTLLDMHIYDAKFNSREMIVYLENEIKQFTKEVIG